MSDEGEAEHAVDGTRKKAWAPGTAQRVGRGTLTVDDPVERLALGRFPDDRRTAGSRWMPRTELGGADQATEVQLVRAYLASDPEVRGRYDTAATWEHAGGSRQAYAEATAELRAELLTRARLHSVNIQAERIVGAYIDSLDAYLDAHGSH